MGKLTFKVRKESTGWIVIDGTAIGPFTAKDRAVDLAAGMVAAIIKAGQEADYIVEDDS